MYFVYVLKSTRAKKIYTGITSDIGRRLSEHNKGLSLYTKRFSPWKLIYKEEVRDRIQARVREKYLKSCAGRKWISQNIFDS